MVARSKPNEIRLVRLYDAPVSAVWQAWTDPEQVAKWWGPRGFTLTTHGKDLKPGGYWSYTMHGPDGTDYVNKTIYYEVEPEKKLVYDHGGADDRPPLFRVTALFRELDGKTELDLSFVLASAEAAQATLKFIKAAGGNATWDRLAEYLDETRLDKTVFVINRSFTASTEAMAAFWREPELLAKWLPASGDMKLLEPHHPKRLMFQQSDLLTTVELLPEDDESSRVVLTTQSQSPTTHRCQALADARTDLTATWNSWFDKLDELLD